MVSWVHYSKRSPERIGRSWGPTLTVIYSYSAESIAARKSTRPTAIMPLLVILFIVSYGILTMLVFEQGQTIESQRGLIHEMLKDSTQLAAMKDKLAREDSKQVGEKASVQADPRARVRVFRQPEQKDRTRQPKLPGKSARSMKQVPGKPAADLEDVRRSYSSHWPRVLASALRLQSALELLELRQQTKRTRKTVL